MNRDELLDNFAREARALVVYRLIKGATGACVLLKGATLADLLYEGELRGYSDTDVLVSFQALPAAEAALASHGYQPAYRIEDGLGVRDVHASTWHRVDNGSEADVHCTLPGLHCTPDEAWGLLSRRTRRCKVAGREVDALDVEASALFVALHAASHGPEQGRPLEDLRRGVAAWSLEVWSDALALATQLDGLQAFGVGLSLVPEGAAMAERLGVASAISTEQRLAWDGSKSWGAHAIEGFASAPAAARARIIWRVVFPPSASMRMSTPLARRGRRGLTVAYALRPMAVLIRFPKALGIWREARRGR